MPTMVDLNDVAKRYGDGPLVLDGVSFRAEKGDLISLIGPSGCGKTTLLRLIAGLSPLSAGSLAVEGRAPSIGSREIACVFQDPTLLPWLTIQKNVELPLRLRGVSTAEREIVAQRMLSLVRLSECAQRYPRQLSGGQRMRASIARALSLSPDILLLDEPFGALDEMTRAHLNEELLDIHRQEAWTGFFVNHSVAEAVFLSNRILIMRANPGRIIHEISVALPYPRTEQTRESGAFLSLVGRVSSLLRAAEPLPA